MIRRFLLHANNSLTTMTAQQDTTTAENGNHNHNHNLGMVSGVGCLRAVKSKRRSNKVHSSAVRKVKAPPAPAPVEELKKSGPAPVTTPPISANTIEEVQNQSIATRSESVPSPQQQEEAPATEDLRPAPAEPEIELQPLKVSESQAQLLIEPNLLFPNTSPLLGAEEMDKYLTRRQVIIQVTTWNMGSLPLPNDSEMTKLFGHGHGYKHEEEVAVGLGLEPNQAPRIDVHVVGIQECWPDVETWEMVLQTALGNGYALFHSVAFGTLHLSIFIRRDLLWFTTEPTDFTQSVRTGRLFKTKGCTGVSFGLFGSRLLFINAHLSAGHQDSYAAQRVDELRKILATCEKSNGHAHGGHHSGAVFLFGDLNFRLFGMKYEGIMEALEQNNITPLLENDQLNYIFRRKDTLPLFLEPFQEASAITFRPTYKYDLGSDTFDSSTKQRAPAYTDRIIYKGKLLPNGNANVVCVEYDGVFDLRVSDHRPVYGIFAVELRPGFNTLALSGARFKRELYVKSIQNQAKVILERRKKLASTVCAVC